MPDVFSIVCDSFPESVDDFIWDVKVHMLMPNQYPCIPNWHFDNVPRVNNKQDFNKVRADLPMYLYVSGEPLTEFRKNGKTWLVNANEWVRFTQEDEHRGTASNIFTWRGFIRATHKDIMPMRGRGHEPIRRHSQVYLDANNFSW
jgi:hypothetical protein